MSCIRSAAISAFDFIRFCGPPLWYDTRFALSKLRSSSRKNSEIRPASPPAVGSRAYSSLYVLEDGCVELARCVGFWGRGTV